MKISPYLRQAGFLDKLPDGLEKSDFHNRRVIDLRL